MLLLRERSVVTPRGIADTCKHRLGLKTMFVGRVHSYTQRILLTRQFVIVFGLKNNNCFKTLERDPVFLKHVQICHHCEISKIVLTALMECGNENTKTL